MNEPDSSTASPRPSTGSEPSSMDDQPATRDPRAEDPPAETAADESPALESLADATIAVPSLPDPVPHAGARYAGLRLLMLFAVGGILYVVGLRGWPLAFAAVLISGIVSLFLLMKQRNDAAVNLEYQVGSWKHRHDHEDAGLAQE